MNLQYVPDLYTCRICLDTEAKLFDINKCGLAPILAEFTSITTFNMPGMPQYVCNFCYFQLQKSAAFRNKCIATQNLLHNCLLMHSLSLEFIQTVDRSKLKLPWTRSELVHLTCIEEVSLSDTGLKQECEVDKVCKAETVVAENDYNVNLCSDDDDHFDNREFSVDVKLETVKNEDIQENESKKSNKRKQKQIATKPKRSKRNEAKKDSVFNVNCEEKEKYDQDKKNEEIIDPLDSDDEVLANKASAKVKKNKTVLKNFDDSEDEDIKEGIKDKRRVVKRGKRENKREAKQNQLDMKRKDDMKRFGEEYNFEVICLTLHDQLQEMEARKTTSNYKESPFKCALCFRGFRSEDTYHSHMLSHDPSTGSEICEICRARFPTRRKLTKHMRSHRTKFICKACAAVFRCSTEAKMHYQGHGGREFVCEHCGKIFTRYRSRVEHIRIYHGTTRCDICYKGVSNAYAVIAHKAKAHREVFICDLCNTSFNKKTALNRHISSLNGALCDTVRPCSACGENFPSEPQLQEHIGTWHPHVRPDSSKRGRRVGSKGKKRCCPCGHRGDYPLPEKPENNPLYPQDYKIMDYKIDIYSKDVYKDDCAPKPISGPYGTFTPLNQCCCPCKTVFKKREKKDEESDVKKKTYMCEVCALDKFPSAAALRNHQRIHTGEKPYQCPLCPKRFRGQEYLTYHLNVHTGERPYKCPNCPKAFKNPTANHRHQLVHNKKRPHRCEICDKTFQTSTYLKIHVRTVHMKIPMPPRVRNRKKILK